MGVSYDYLDEMTWREFTLRRAGFLRKRTEEWEQTRFIAYFSLIATGALDSKKTTMQAFLPLDRDGGGRTARSRITDEQRAILLEEQRKYLQQVEQNNGGRT